MTYAMQYLMDYLASVAEKREEGQGTIEYVLVLGVIVVGIFGLMNFTGLGGAINTALGEVIGLFSSDIFNNGGGSAG